MLPKRSILLGVVGDSASGKTTISKGIAKIIGEDRVTIICIDDYHKYDRVQRAEKNISALDPECNHIDIMQQHLNLLSQGEPIIKPIYNHTTGAFDAPEYIKPKQFVIIEGLLAFHTKRMRDTFDVKIYLDPEEDLRVAWKVKRDTSNRGYEAAEVAASLKRREKVSAAFIRPQRRYADIVVNFHRPEENKEESGAHLSNRLILRPTIKHPDFSEFVDDDACYGKACLSLTLGRDEGMPVDILYLNGAIEQRPAEALEDIIWDHLPGLEHLRNTDIGRFVDGAVEKVSYPLGITQLLTTYHLFTALEAIEG